MVLFCQLFILNFEKKKRIHLGQFFFTYFSILFNFGTIFGNPSAITRVVTKRTERQNRQMEYSFDQLLVGSRGYFVVRNFSTLFNFGSILGNPAGISRVEAIKPERQNRRFALVVPLLPLGFLRLARLISPRFPRISSYFDVIQIQSETDGFRIPPCSHFN